MRFHLHYEATAFAPKRDEAESSLDRAELTAFLAGCKLPAMFMWAIQANTNLDDAQPAEDAKVFVSVTLEAMAHSDALARRLRVPSDLLSHIAEHAALVDRRKGNPRFTLDGGWRLSSVEQIDY